MKHVLLKDKFPVFTLDIPKAETSFKNTDEVIEYLKSKVEAHPTSSFIAVFDHLNHIKAQNGEIDSQCDDRFRAAPFHCGQ